MYILSESLMNGTVTMKTILTGIQTLFPNDFNNAKKKVLNQLATRNITYIILEDSHDKLYYTIGDLIGIMENKELYII
jgi:hypothetical protein